MEKSLAARRDCKSIFYLLKRLCPCPGSKIKLQTPVLRQLHCARTNAATIENDLRFIVVVVRAKKFSRFPLLLAPASLQLLLLGCRLRSAYYQRPVRMNSYLHPPTLSTTLQQSPLHNLYISPPMTARCTFTLYILTIYY